MNELKHIDAADLIFENKPLKDRINTRLTLQDTDWMNYVLQVVFRTKNQGVLKVMVLCQDLVQVKMRFSSS